MKKNIKHQNDSIQKPNNLQEPQNGKSKAFSPIRVLNYVAEDNLNQINHHFHQEETMNDYRQSSGVSVSNQIKEKVIEQRTQPTLDYIKSQTEFEDLDFINTLLKLKGQSTGASSNAVNNSNYDMFYLPHSSLRKEQNTINNNDDSKSYIREILDICDPKAIHHAVEDNNNDTNALRNSNYNENNYSKMSKGLQRNDLIEISNRRKKMADSLTSVDSYLRRRHLEELAKVEKIRKDNRKKELGDGNFMPKINQKSKMICERLTRAKYQQPINEYMSNEMMVNERNINENRINMNKSLDNNIQLTQQQQQHNSIKSNEPINNNKEMNNQMNTFDDLIVSTIKEYSHPSNYHDWIEKKYQQYNSIPKTDNKKYIEFSESIGNNHKSKETSIQSQSSVLIKNSLTHIVQSNIEQNDIDDDDINFEQMENQKLNHTSPLKEDNREAKRINLKSIKEEVRQKALLSSQSKRDNQIHNDRYMTKSTKAASPYIQIPFDIAQYQLKSLMNPINQELLIDDQSFNYKTPQPTDAVQRQSIPDEVSNYSYSNINQSSHAYQHSKNKAEISPINHDNVQMEHRDINQSDQFEFNVDDIYNSEYVVNHPVPLSKLVQESNMTDDDYYQEENELYNFASNANNNASNNDNNVFDSCMEKLFSSQRNYYSDILGIATNNEQNNNNDDDHIVGVAIENTSDAESKTNREIKEQKIVKAEINLFDEDEDEDEFNHKETINNNIKEHANPKDISIKKNPLSQSQDNTSKRKNKQTIESIQEINIEYDIEELMNPKYLFKHANTLNTINETKKVNKNSKSVSNLEHISEEKTKVTAKKFKQNNSTKQATLYTIFQPKKTETQSTKLNTNQTTTTPNSNSNIFKAKYEFKPKKKNTSIPIPIPIPLQQPSIRNNGIAYQPSNIALQIPNDNIHSNQIINQKNMNNVFEGGYFKKLIQQEKGKIDCLLQSTETLASNILSTKKTL